MDEDQKDKLHKIQFVVASASRKMLEDNLSLDDLMLITSTLELSAKQVDWLRYDILDSNS